MDIRLIALDLDGTALNSSGQLTERTRTALADAAEAGVVIAAATGRAYCALPDAVLHSSVFSYAITSNGTGIYSLPEGRHFYSNYMSEENVRALLGLLCRYPCPMEVFIDGIAYADACYVKDPASFHIPQRSVAYVRRTRTPVEDIPALIRQNIHQIEGMDIIVTDMELKKEIRSAAGQIPDLYITSSVSHYVEFAAGSASKETALDSLASGLNIHPSQVMTFGDGENDLEMLRYAGLGVAMGNACALLKDAADHITDTNDRDGVALAVETFVLGR